MELALNIVWLVVSAVATLALARWSLHQAPGPASRRRLRFAATAVLCLVALLFPIISITDDLCQDVLLVEASVKRRDSHGENHHERITTPMAVGIVPAAAIVVNLTCIGLAAVECVFVTTGGALVWFPARAPPRLVL